MVRTAELDAGALIAGRYRVRELLGVGGMSRVYLAHDESLGRDVALKVFSSAIGDGSEAHRRRDEVTMLAGLTHPALVVLFDAALDADPPFLTMEYVVGETLAERLRRGPLPANEAEPLVIAITEALDFVHERGIVHRDVKPGNILLPASAAATGPPAKLTDFGIARLVDSGRMTATGTVLGTAAYISPEQASGGVAGPPSDIYSLGLVFVEMLTGEHPFPGTALESAAARLARPPELGSPVLAPYRSLLERMTAQAPLDRPTAAEVAADLAGQARTRAMTPVEATTAALVPVGRETRPPVQDGPAAVPDGPGRRPGFRRRLVLILAAILGALAVAAVVLLPATRPATVQYPEVPGALGIHLGQLQDAVAGTGLENAVLAATTAAADGDYPEADQLLVATATLSEQSLAAAAVDDEQAAQIDAAIAAARADIAALLPPPAEVEPQPADPGPAGGPGGKDDEKDKKGKGKK